MALFKRKKDSQFEENNKNMVNSNKKRNVTFSSSVRPEGMSRNTPMPNNKARSIFQPNTLYGMPVTYQSTSKGAKPTVQTPRFTKPTQTKQQEQTQQARQPSPTVSSINELARQSLQQGADARNLAQQSYQQQAPEIMAAYDTQMANYQRQQQDIQAQMDLARQQEAQNRALIEQQYGQQAQQAEVSSERDLRRAAEARRLQQAQLERKFANLGTLGSTGYFGQSGETQRSESEFLRGQQDIMAQRQATINDINNQKNTAIINAQNNVNTILSNYQQQINDLNNNMAIAYGDKVVMANQLYTDLQDRLSKIDSDTRNEIATYNKQLFDIEQTELKTMSDIEKARLENIPETPTIEEVLNVEDALNLTNNLLEEGNIGAITGTIRGVETPIYNRWSGALETQEKVNSLINKLTLLERSGLKGQGQITDFETRILQNAFKPENIGNVSETYLRQILGQIQRKLIAKNNENMQLLQGQNPSRLQNIESSVGNYTITEIE